MIWLGKVLATILQLFILASLLQYYYTQMGHIYQTFIGYNGLFITYANLVYIGNLPNHQHHQQLFKSFALIGIRVFNELAVDQGS